MAQGIYKVSAKGLGDLESGKWYFGVDCPACGKPIALFDDESCGTKPIYFAGEGDMHAACPHCGAEHLYSPNELKSFLHALMKPGRTHRA
jgi:endogenous inhibitor of DNA gyrase (YacG/DUF329 family)